MLRAYAYIMLVGMVAIGSVLWLSTPRAETLTDSNQVVFPKSEVTIIRQNKEDNLVYRVEVASNFMQHAVGLQHRTSLASDAGMLFLYGLEKQVSMWMKDTYIPLDMLFISKRGEIVSIHQDAVPGAMDEISAFQPVSAVLELNAGDVERGQINVGDRVLHASFR